MISLTKNLRLAAVLLALLSGALAVFDADVRWSCSEDVVSIFVRTSQPFEGLVQTRNSDSEACRVQGFGTNVAVLKLSLKGNGNGEECGIKYDIATRTHSVTVDVHSHPVLIVEGDKTVNVTCREIANGTNYIASQVSSPDYQLRVLSSRLPVDTVKYSQPYTLQVRPSSTNSQKSPYSFFVGQCTAQPIDGNSSVHLTDPVGCALYKSIMGHFFRREVVEEAEIPSMFRFPNAKKLKISCSVTECDGKCEERICESPESSASSLLDRTTSSVESEDSQRIWTIVDIEDVAFSEPPSLLTSENLDAPEEPIQMDSETPPPNLILQKSRDEIVQSQCIPEHEFNLLYYLCIFLAVCSIIGFSMNIILALMLKRRSSKKSKKTPIPVEQLQIPKSTVVQPDFWIIENQKEEPEPTYYAPRRESFSSYASKPNRRIIMASASEYGVPVPAPASRNSDGSGSSSEDRSSNDIYRRPNQIEMIRPDPSARHSNSTFMTHSTTMETDIDSQASNQATSYH